MRHALPIIILLVFAAPLFGQARADSVLPNIVLFVEGSGFIPFDESYRINYKTSLAGHPVEVAGGARFPITESLSSLLSVHYKRRQAEFVPDFRIKTLEIELGVYDYLEKAHENDLRLFGTAGLLLAKSSAEGIIDATSDGTKSIPTEVSKDYYNIGIGLGLGIEYPLTKISGLYAAIHIAVYFADPVSGGGLGNIGGVSVGLGYRLNLD